MDRLTLSYQRIPHQTLYNAKIVLHPQKEVLRELRQVTLPYAIKVMHGLLVKYPDCQLGFRPRPITDNLEGDDSTMHLHPNDEQKFRSNVDDAVAMFAPVVVRREKEKP